MSTAWDGVTSDPQLVRAYLALVAGDVEAGEVDDALNTLEVSTAPSYASYSSPCKLPDGHSTMTYASPRQLSSPCSATTLAAL